jgi:hypothetical protein
MLNKIIIVIFLSVIAFGIGDLLIANHHPLLGLFTTLAAGLGLINGLVLVVLMVLCGEFQLSSFTD